MKIIENKTKTIFLALIFLGIFGMAEVSFAADFTPGLLYKDGIEPGDPSVCEAPAGKRCWWVDANAPAGGNGSYASPYNSFETVVGNAIFDGSCTVGQIRGGDYLYVKGTFTQDGFNQTTHNTTIFFCNTIQFGSVSEPTIIKSWRGSPRAIFDGNYSKDHLLAFDLGSHQTNASVNIYNIEVLRAEYCGIKFRQHINSAEVAGVVIHHTDADGGRGMGGGITFTAKEPVTSSQFELRNSLIYNNDENPYGEDNGGETNRGGVSILSEPVAPVTSRISIHDNEIYNEMNAIRHKHQGNILIEVYNNSIHDNFAGFYLRNKNNKIHHNLVYNNEHAFRPIGEVLIADQYSEIYNNTFYNNLALMSAAESTSYHRYVNFHDNISYNPGTPWGSGTVRFNAGMSPADWTGNHNIFYGTSQNPFMADDWVNSSFTNFQLQTGDTSVWSNPNMVDPANHDFHLQPTSPAIDAGTGGTDIGAFEYASGAPPDTTPPIILSVSSGKANGSYSVGEVIDVAVTFSEAVTSTGSVAVTLETGAIDRVCSFTATNSATGTCNYIVQSGDNSLDLTVNSIAGSIVDQNGNAMINFNPTINLSANKALVIDTTSPVAPIGLSVQ